MKQLGLDLGTKHIVLAYQDDAGVAKIRYEVNGYLVLERGDAFTEQLLVRSSVPFVRRGEEIIAIGGKAESLAYTFNKTLSRPMAHGGVQMSNDDAQEIIAIIIKSIIGNLHDDTTLYYCTTAKPVNSDLINIDFHKRVVKLIIESYRSTEKKPDGSEIRIAANHINEARCLIIDEPGAAIGISWGAGTVTVNASVMGMPIFEFSILGAGDWIDEETAKRFGFDPEKPGKESIETPTTICRRKESLDLSKMPEDNVGKAITLMYEILIENVVKNIAKGLKENKEKFRFDQPIPVINAGGTCIPNGFMEFFKKKVSQLQDQLVVPIGEIKRADDPLFAVAKGCLKAAIMHRE